MALPSALEPVTRSPREAALVTDFDGTLSPIVDDPVVAAALPEALHALRVLVDRLALVAVLSGRPVTFLRDRVPIDGVALVGQYGLERLVDGEVVIDPRVEEHLDAVAAAAAEAERTWPELFVERKGDIAFTIHWRTAPGHAPPLSALEQLARRYGLALQPGRKACELRPPVPTDKGSALLDLISVDPRPDPVAFAGDDRGDLAAFEALDRAAEQQEGGLAAIRIAVSSAEAPAELLEQADVVVDGPPGLADLLTALADAVSRPPP